MNENNNNFMDNYKQWIESPYVDKETNKKLKAIKDDENLIKESFHKNLEFGTGGLRGIIGVGTNRINLYTIRKATQGLANYISNCNAEMKKVAIAYDSRYYSEEFALESALVLAANGIKAYLFDDLRPTPELSYAVRYLKCNAGIVITASHNPKEYNGYKVYGADGGQITLDMADGIINEINNIDIFEDVKTINKKDALDKELLTYIGEDIDNIYLEEISKITFNKTLKKEDKNITIIYTPLHGSGLMPVTKIMKKNGYDNVYVVEEQSQPDGGFPTVKSPNPEEKESLKMAIEMGKEKCADVILGTDPDADRVGVAIKDGKEYRLLTGNQIGALLTYYIVNKEDGKTSNNAIIKTIVTSDLGAKIAKSKGVKVFNTLTGFKFIGEKIKEFEENNSYNFLFGYEESYGYLAGTFVRDKDAVIASALIVEMTAFYKKQGLSITELLEKIYKQYGYYEELLESFTFEGIEGKEKIKKIVKMFKNKSMLTNVFDNIQEIEDYESGKVYIIKENTEKSLTLPKSDVIKIKFMDESWLAIRPSGTEPKLKIYYSVVEVNEERAKEQLSKIKNKIAILLDGKN